MKFISDLSGYFNPNQRVMILAGQTDSSPLDCGGMMLTGILFPSLFTGTTITFKASSTLGGTYRPLYDNTNALISATVQSGRAYALNPALFRGIQFLKVVSNATESQTRLMSCSLRGLTSRLPFPSVVIPPQPPSAHLIMWVDGSLVYQDTGRTILATATNDPVRAWADQSGSGNHWTVNNNFGNAIGNALLKLAAKNGQPSVVFNKHAFTFATALNLSLCTTFIVYKASSTVDQVVLLFTSGNNTPSPPNNYIGVPTANAAPGSPGFYVTGDGGACTSPNVTDPSLFHLAGTGLDGVNSHMYNDGVDGTPGAGTGCTFNSFSLWPPTNADFIGELCEALIYDAFLSDSDRLAVETYLNEKYMIY